MIMQIKLIELFEAYSIKQKCCDIIADKINEMRTALLILVTYQFQTE